MATSVGSTVLDVPALVSQLMSIERRPIDKLNARVTDFQAKISSLGSIKGLLSSFQTALKSLQDSLQGYSATSSDSNAFSASATASATAGSYAISVSRLAQAQNLAAAGQVSQTVSIPSVASTVTFTIGGNPMDVTIAAGATLQDIRDAVNGAKLGVTASIINDGSGTPYRLVLTADKTGVANSVSSITVQPGGDSAINDLLAWNPTANAPAAQTMAETMAAQDARLTVNGITITSASNTISDTIAGVTLTLKNTTTGPATLAVARDTGNINAAVGKFVEAYNALIKEVKSRSAYGAAGAAAPALAGDSAVRQMLDELRGIFTTPATGGTLSYLAEAGISTQTNGTLTFDSGKFGSALTSKFGDVANLLTSATGVLTRLDAWASTTLQTGGLLESRTKGWNDTIRSLNEQIAKLERKMTALQKQYTTTYSNLNLFLANMNSTSSYLSSQLSKSV